MVEYIERDAAIRAALSCTDSFEPIEVDITVESVVSKLRKLPIADVQPVKWIPVTERLPDSDTEYVLCCGSKGGMFVGWAAIKSYDGSGKCTGFQNSGKGRSFTHWMPLPEPPKDGET